jgi:hypothetical protein
MYKRALQLPERLVVVASLLFIIIFYLAVFYKNLFCLQLFLYFRLDYNLLIAIIRLIFNNKYSYGEYHG